MDDVLCKADGVPQKVLVAVVRSEQIAATVGRGLFGKLKCVTNMIIYRNPSRCQCASAATFGAILDVDSA